MKKADLHMHTTLSDGLLTPEEVVRWAYKKNIDTISITDHDSIDGISRAILESKKYDINVVPGIELSCFFQDHEIHILGYFIDYKSEKLNKFIKKLKESRKERNYKIIEKLNKMDIDISVKEVEMLSSEGVIGRPHIARVLIDKGIVDTVKGAFDIYLSKGKPAYVERYKVSVKDAIDLIHSIGGVAVFAHPGLINNSMILNNILQFKIDGLEVIHSKHNKDQVEELTNIAKHNNLIVTAGSDCHGYLDDGEPSLGNFFISAKDVELLKEKADFYKKML